MGEISKKLQFITDQFRDRSQLRVLSAEDLTGSNERVFNNGAEETAIRENGER